MGPELARRWRGCACEYRRLVDGGDDRAGVFGSDWLPGPEDGTPSSVVVSFTDFRGSVTEDLTEIYRTGIDLGQNWPIMSGAVGLWMWANDW